MTDVDNPQTDTFSARSIKIHFAGVKAVDGVDLDVACGEILGLIGPNGAGKTTLVNGLSGVEKLTSGSIFLGVKDVTGWPPQRLSRAGIGRTFQHVRLFGRLTILENVEAAALGAGGSRREAVSRAREILVTMGLSHLASTRAENLPAGISRQVGIARALATKPRFLLLDEPAAGLNEDETEQLVALINVIRTPERGIVLIEHDMRVIMDVCDRIQVLDYGKTLSCGIPAKVRADPAVLAAYLGQPEEVPGGRGLAT